LCYKREKDKNKWKPIENLILLGGAKKSGKSCFVKDLIPGHFPICGAPGHIRHPHRFWLVGRLADQNLKIMQDWRRVYKQAISLRDQLEQKLSKVLKMLSFDT